MRPSIVAYEFPIGRDVIRATPDAVYSYLRTPELEGLAHQFCARWIYVCSKFVEINQIKINPMKYAMCNVHINDYDSK